MRRSEGARRGDGLAARPEDAVGHGRAAADRGVPVEGPGAPAPAGRDGEAAALDWLRELVEADQESVWLLLDADDQFRLLEAGAGLERLYGRAAAALAGALPHDYSETLAAAAQGPLPAALEAGLAYAGEHTERDGGGALLRLRLVLRGIRRQGRLLAAGYLRLLCRPTHQQRRARREQRLAEQRARHTRLIQAIPDPVWLKDADGVYLACNAAWARLLGHSEAGIVGADDPQLFPDATALQFAARDGRALGGDPLLCEEAIDLGRGRVALLETRRVPMRDATGRVTAVLGIARDITVRRENEERLRMRDQEFRALVENSPDTVVRYDRHCRRLYVNPRFCEALGLAPEQLLGGTPAALGAAEAPERFEAAIRQVFATGEESRIEIDWRSAEGVSRCSDVRMVPERDATGAVISVLAVGHEVTELKEQGRRLRQAEAMAQLGYWEWEMGRGRASVSSEVCRIFAKPRDWSPTREEVFCHILKEDRERVEAGLAAAYRERREEIALEYRVQVNEGVRYINSHLRIEYDRSGAPARLVGTTQDVSRLKEYQERLHSLSFFDPVTGLPNRTLLARRIEQATEQAQRSGRQVALLSIGLKEFESVNDILGRAVGDQLLRELAQRLAGTLRETDVVARTGGDRFAVVLSGIASAGDIERIGRKLLATIAEPFQSGGREQFLGAGIGVARHPGDGFSAAELMQNADVAMDEAKRARSDLCFYSQHLTARTAEQLALANHLRHALRNGELEVYYQPQVSLESGTLLGAEALLRWNHPEFGLVTPDRFIGIAEETGLIIAIGEWVLREACAAARAWNRARNGPPLRVAVNLSARQFRGHDLVETVARALAESGCQGAWLELEITESLLVEEGAGVRGVLERLREMGISFAIDDFGTGYSALGYLNRFPVQSLKIDRSFVRNILTDRGSAELVKAIVSLALSLQLELVAEGIEQCEQAEMLSAYGCRNGQGYLYGRPMPRARFERELIAGGRPWCSDAAGSAAPL